MEYNYSDFHRRGIPSRCPNLRKKSNGFFKGYTYSCSASKNVLDSSYVTGVCTFYKSPGPKVIIKYDECNKYRLHGIVN